ncbi:winged helix-turn-helix transcriptional regulator [Frondihabitans australicus]|uniref:HxlR family transcriptional regulator n=1 Tax=Frondihabitans australicus TaxID=386892 RepID=A0A495IMW1_9MICO|nr:helix-turn-helix domain-containing protein [Frondihabitans australicus]RKR76506.1 HxlR family transcriptional regulator [Frondihabitans australicus]
MSPRVPAVTENTPLCSIERSVDVLSDRWSFLVLRNTIHYGQTRFGEIQKSLGIASNVLSSRLDALVDAGILTRVDYQEPGARRRERYEPTPAGADLRVVLAALQQWGDEHLPRTDGPTMLRRGRTGGPIGVGFVDEAGRQVPADEVRIVPSRPAA